MAEQREVNMEEMNFLDLYLRAIGRTEVPIQFHVWTALSLLSACLEQRVWYERMAYQKIYPNLYIFLIGGSGSGKGTAIGTGIKVIEAMKRIGYGDLNYYRGAMTRAAMQDELAERWTRSWKEFEVTSRAGTLMDEPSGVSLYTMAPELSSNMSVGPQAKDMIKFLTDLWEGGVGKYQERTRGSGAHEFKNPCLGVLAGSAPEWAREVVDNKDLASGFWARVMCVRGERDRSLRIARPDTRYWDLLLPTIAWRLSFLISKASRGDKEFAGQMVLSPEADRMDIEWYEQRDDPVDDLYEAHWKRQPDQVMRIAMLLRFCDFWDLQGREDEEWRVIGVRHWMQAKELSDTLMRNATTFLGESLSHANNGYLATVEDIIRKRIAIRQRPDLLRLVSRHGLSSKDLEKCIQALEDEGKVERDTLTEGNFRVMWRG